ncbi:MAG TPA: efflux RND transporter periplasmic adaptor subunit, partial [Planctomycetota bacterium]|nr:efflux RND transporter periplasmic adaptor subunit [Planctomycetota bacterium]
SLSAPSLFLLAKDLTKMLVLVQTNEADVGHVHPGDSVKFTADAFPGVPFTGEVRKIRLNATQTQNVVTYTSEILTDNSTLKLLPYLTANVTFIIERREKVLAVPNAALRWSPRGQGRPGHGPAADDAEHRSGSHEGGDKKPPLATLWILGPEGIRPEKVRAGISDGSVTEVEGDGIHEGDPIVVDEATPGTPGTTTSNPFAPKLQGPRR